MDASSHFSGQRLSLRNHTCTVRYIGPVAGKPGEWLGVEWDDPQRGKHNGEHEGVKYFSCRSHSPAAGSFIRPSQPWDKSRTFLEALKEKYVSGNAEASGSEVIYVSGKLAEEVGFDKFAQRQAELRGINVLVLDRMRIRHQQGNPDAEEITKLCSNITDVDLSGNLFETLGEIVDLCRQFPKLRRLTLDRNRFSIDESQRTLTGVEVLSVSNVLLNYREVSDLLRCNFPNTRTLTASNNEWCEPTNKPLCSGLHVLDLSANEFESMDSVYCLANGHVRSLILKYNRIREIDTKGESRRSPNIVEDLDLSYNNIGDFTFFNGLATCFHALKHLRVSGNPLYKDLKSSEGKSLTAEDGYMLTVARFSHLEMLNYSKIAEKERLNAEAYYLTQIAAELAVASTPEQEAETLQRHPRWNSLCGEYGEPIITKISNAPDQTVPNSLATRLVTITFYSIELGQSWTEELPKSFDIYAVIGIVGKRLGIMPLKLRLLWETDERDPVGSENRVAGPEWWDSDESEGDDTDPTKSAVGGQWVAREVELLPGTRAMGTYFEDNEARVRVETKA